MSSTKLISFDLQGTLSDSAFSDEFWLDLIPSLYAKKHQLTVIKAKELLEKEFRLMGKYHELFYNYRLRLNSLLPKWTFNEIVRMLNNQPKLDNDILHVLKKIPNEVPKIIISATTRDFIDLELGHCKSFFQQTFSTIDDFNTPGKPPSLFVNIANHMKVKPEHCLHIGDCAEMDYENAKSAGWQSYHLNKQELKTPMLFGLEQAITRFIECGYIRIIPQPR
jgi:putative hydrolase of the HAD superfamily